MSLQGFKTCLGGCSFEGFDEGWFGEGVVGVFVLICKEWSILGWLVDPKMMGSALSESVSLFCLDHGMLSPWVEVLDQGSWKAVLLRPFLLRSDVTLEGLM